MERFSEFDESHVRKLSYFHKILVAVQELLGYLQSHCLCLTPCSVSIGYHMCTVLDNKITVGESSSMTLSTEADFVSINGVLKLEPYFLYVTIFMEGFRTIM